MDFSFLAGTALFRGTGEAEVRNMLDCLGAREKQFGRGETVFHAGQTIESMGLVMSGSVNIELDDFWGSRTILGHFEAGQLFAETYACLSGEPMLVSAAACEASSILFLNAARLLTVCPSSCAHHSRLIQNLLQILAQKNLALSRRSVHTAPKSIRGRLLSYLSEQAQRSGSRRFAIPFNRQQLADYLGVDRSALSGELSKMRRDGILTCEKNIFYLCQLP